MTPKIDRNSSVPLQKQLYKALKAWFVSDFSSSDLLPTELAISKEFGISQGTVRIALDKLVGEEIIVRIPGRGTLLNPDYKIKLSKYRIGVILSEIDFFTNTIWEYAWINHLEIINGIVESNIPFNISTEFISEDYLDESCCDLYDGFILWPYVQNSLTGMLGKPWVQLDYRIDMPRGFRQLAEDVVLRKHQKVGYIGFTSGGRIETINKTFKKGGLPPLKEDVIYECGGSAAEAYRSCMELMNRNPGLDCLICSTDLRAQGALQYLQEQGLDVPGQVAVYGFDGTRNNRRIRPSLTTCRFDWQAPGAFAVKQIRCLLDGEELSEYQPVRGSLVLQDSTRR